MTCTPPSHGQPEEGQLDAEKAAPEAVAHNIMAREIMREMLARAKRGHGSSLQALATRAGVLH